MSAGEIADANRLAAETPGQAVRAIGGKTRWDWMPWTALHEVALVYTICQSTPAEHPRGIGKYRPWNWLSGTGLPLMGYFRGAWSHMFRFFIIRETHDDETGLHHLAHAGWNVLCALETVMRGKGVDDRPTDGGTPDTVRFFGGEVPIPHRPMYPADIPLEDLP